MSSLDRARPHGYGKVAKHARRHVRSIESKQDHSAIQYPDPRDATNTHYGANTVPGYYFPSNAKYLDRHPREQYNWIGADKGKHHDPAIDPMTEEYEGFKRDLEQEDIDRWDERRQIAHQAMYDQWITRRFDITNPHVARWLQKIEPEFWERRWAFLQDKMKLETFVTRMRLYGPQTREDFEGLYALWRDGGYANNQFRPKDNDGRMVRARYVEGRLARGDRFKNNEPIEEGARASSYSLV